MLDDLKAVLNLVAEIRRQNALELEVYRVAGHLLDAQVALARGATGEKPGQENELITRARLWLLLNSISIPHIVGFG